jgi:hypothetical protein
MNPTDSRALGGFEERLLERLRTHVDGRLALSYRQEQRPQARTRSRRRPGHRTLLSAVAAVGAVLLAGVSLVPVSQPTIAQAFPILTHRPRILPALLAGILRADGVTPRNARLDLNHAYSFRTPTGTGYVVLDRGTKWLCIVVPGFLPGRGGARCGSISDEDRASGLLGALVVYQRPAREEIVQVLPKGSTATIITGSGPTRQVALRTGVLAVVTHGAATVSTTVDGRRTTTTYYSNGTVRAVAAN